MLSGKAVMINWSDVALEHRNVYYEWHNREHMVGRVSLPTFFRGRRYVAIDAKRDFLILYELQGVDVLTGNEYLAKANAPSDLTRRTTPFVKNAIRGLTNVRSSFGIGVGGVALTVRCSPKPGGDEDAARYLDEVALPKLAEQAGIVGAHRLETDKAASSVATVERQGRPTTVPDWVVVMEALDAEELESARHSLLDEQQLVLHGVDKAIHYDSYRLQIMVTK